MCGKLALAVVGLAISLSSVTQGASIIWVSDCHQSITGATTPDDQGWVDLLRSAGHTVDQRIPTTAGTGVWRTLDSDELAALEAADLVIISRDTSSSEHASNDAERTQWSSLKTPLILLQVYLAQGGTNNRWQWINSSTISARQAYYLAKAVDSTHQVFTGVNLSAGGEVAWLDQTISATYGNCSYISVTAVGNGKIIAARPDNNYAVIVEWAPGTPFHSGTTQTPADKRMLFCAGTEQTSSGSVGWGVMNLTADGKKMFLNAVRYMLGLPPVDGIAASPSPVDKATDVGRGVALSWKQGPFAATHNVYLGTNFDDVDTATVGNPKGVLVSQGQDANTFDPPGSLTYGQTYYWRVDEVNAPPTSATVFRGSVWNFTVETVGNKIAGASITATASSVDPGRDPNKTTDGSGLDASDQHSMDLTQMWNSAAGAVAPVWLQYDFDRVYKMYEMWVWNHNTQFESLLGFGLKDVTVEYSTDGTQWTALGNFVFAQAPGDATYAHNTTIDFGGVAAQHVRLTATSNWGGKQYGLSEVRFFYIPVVAREPSPSSGAADQTPGLTLGWRSGREAASHQVYFGTDANALTLAGTVTQNSLTPASMNFGTIYYWRVDEVNDAATPSLWTGDTWNFSTQPYAAIDDMESYNDSTNCVYNVWLDGYSTPTTNGSVVGLGTAVNGTFCDTTTFHGGKASMPMSYTNTTPSYSEAERAWDTPQNWKVNGANTISLWYRGNPTGFVELAANHILMNGMGTDIFNAADEGRFVYKQLTGNGTLIARVDRLDAIEEWSKAGVMIRQSLDAGSSFAMAVLGANQGMRIQYRLTAGGTAASDTTPATVEQKAVRAPVWLKIERIGTAFNAYYATTAAPTTWIASPLNPQTITMTDPVYIGLGVTSHLNTRATQAEFSEIATTGNVTGNWQSADLGIAQPAGNTLETLYVTIKDSAGKSVTVKNPDIAAVGAGVWQQWKIPISSLTGVDVSRVKSMIIGVGDRTNPKHGSGLIYIDDIAYGRPLP